MAFPAVLQTSSSSLLLSSLELSDTKVYAAYIRALLETASHLLQTSDTGVYMAGVLALMKISLASRAGMNSDRSE